MRRPLPLGSLPRTHRLALTGLTLALLQATLGCAGAKPRESWSDNRAAAPGSAQETVVPILTNNLSWASEIYSPRTGSHSDPELDELVELLGPHDPELSLVAEEVARLSIERGALPSLDEVSFLLKKRGVPYVSPRLWTATVEGGSASLLGAELKKFSQASSRRGTHYYGLGVAKRPGGFVAVAFDAETLALVQPVPTRLAQGQQLPLLIDMTVDASLVEVIVLPPSGGPRHFHGQLSGTRFKTTLKFFEAGPHLVQVLATVEGGPMPVSSMLVTVGEDPPNYFESRDVPGEKNFRESEDLNQSLLELINGARAESGLRPVQLHPVLSEVALRHTELMQKQGRISHDAGDDTPAVRVESQGLKPRATGENVAQAPSLIRLHRALWASPSHRENLLLSRWNFVGIGIVRDERGQLYATELFSDLPE